MTGTSTLGFRFSESLRQVKAGKARLGEYSREPGSERPFGRVGGRGCARYRAGV